jgi:hypothetical protein
MAESEARRAAFFDLNFGSDNNTTSTEVGVTMKPKIHLALTDDWELRGNGSGDIERLQFHPMRELARIYRAHHVRASFNAELMQQLTFRKFQDEHPELKPLADAWDDIVRETFQQGFDIQLHIHPQWRDAKYEDGRWNLTADWSLLKHDAAAVYQMIAAGKEYLESLLRPIDSSYRCISFRAGAWCIAPSAHLLGHLAKLGIVFDMSIVGGLFFDTRNIKLDYTQAEEDFLPFYPRMDDARKISHQQEEIICVPTHHFYGSRRQVFKHHLSVAWRKAKQKITPATAQAKSPGGESYYQEWGQTNHRSSLNRLYDKGLVPYLKGKHLISDVAQLDDALLREMLQSIRDRAKRSGLAEVPVILTNHSKDIRDFTPIERFIGEAAQADEIEFLTLTDFARKLQAGVFPIKCAAR